MMRCGMAAYSADARDDLGLIDEAVRSDHQLGQVMGHGGKSGGKSENRARPPKRWEGQEVSGSDRRAEVSET